MARADPGLQGPTPALCDGQGLQQEAVLWSRLCGPLSSASPDSLIFIVPRPPFSLLESFSPPGGGTVNGRISRSSQEGCLGVSISCRNTSADWACLCPSQVAQPNLASTKWPGFVEWRKQAGWRPAHPPTSLGPKDVCAKSHAIILALPGSWSWGDSTQSPRPVCPRRGAVHGPFHNFR